MDDKAKFVDEFLRRYGKEYDFFDQASRLAAQKLGGRLTEAGIRSIVTSRAKAIDRLRNKVEQRSPRKMYASAEDIFNDVIDLAGVRVAMYFPGQLPQVEKIILSLFNLEGEPKKFPDPETKPPYEKRFSGYLATHYKGRLNDTVLTDTEKRYNAAIIEIQVASVLMHSWAEVEHDLVYKPQQGPLSEEEYDILDELNGLVLAGEIALKRLQKAGEIRVAVRGRSFSNHYDLASYLLDASVPVVGESVATTNLGRIDLLFELLKSLNLGTPEKLEPYIKALSPDFEKAPLAEQIIDQVVKEDKEKYRIYEKLQANRLVAGHHLALSRTELDADTDQELSRFLDEWVGLEQKVNQMAKGSPSEGIYPSRALLEKLGVKDQDLLREFERIRRMRNAVVHGLTLPPLADLREAGSRIRWISEQLEQIQ